MATAENHREHPRTVRFQVEIVHLAGNQRAVRLSRLLHGTLSCDPSSPGLSTPDIPVRVWTTISGARSADRLSDRHGVIWIAILDDDLMQERPWRDWLLEISHSILSATSEGEDDEREAISENALPDHLIPVCEPDCEGVVRQVVGALNYRVIDPEQFDEDFLNQILISLIHFHVPHKAAYDVFISYVRDETGKAWRKRLTAELEKHPYLRPFYDEKDLIAGAPYRSRFEAVIRSSAFLSAYTDRYSSRTETVRELDIAKRHDRPILIVDCLKTGESRTFAYLGNCRMLRAEPTDSLAKVVTELLLEILEFEAFKGHAADFEDGRMGVEIVKSFRPPELHSVVSRLNDKDICAEVVSKHLVFLYPDPPITYTELRILSELRERLTFLTPVQLAGFLGMSSSVDSEIWQPLYGRKIQISASPTAGELSSRGLTEEHVAQCVIEFARHLIAAGATIVFGGRFEEDTVGEWLARILEIYGHSEGPQHPRILALLPFPIWLNMSTQADREFGKLALVTRIDPPDDLSDLVGRGSCMPAKGRDLEWKFAWARSLTAARRRIAGVTDAVVLIGGKQSKYLGRYAGIVEEALCAMQAREPKPIYAVGYLGGCAAAIGDALSHSHETEWDRYPAFAPDEENKEFINLYNKKIDKGGDSRLRLDFDELRAWFADATEATKTNGLNEDENRQLWRSNDLSACLKLVLKGLINQFGK